MSRKDGGNHETGLKVAITKNLTMQERQDFSKKKTRIWKDQTIVKVLSAVLSILAPEAHLQLKGNQRLN